MITIYGKEACGFCTMSKTLCESKGVEYTYLSLGEDYDAEAFYAKFPNAKTFPQIIVDDESIGGFNELRQRLDNE